MRLMYVFNPRESSGYLCRVPEFVAYVIYKLSRGRYDYAPTEAGY